MRLQGLRRSSGMPICRVRSKTRQHELCIHAVQGRRIERILADPIHHEASLVQCTVAWRFASFVRCPAGSYRKWQRAVPAKCNMRRHAHVHHEPHIFPSPPLMLVFRSGLVNKDQSGSHLLRSTLLRISRQSRQLDEEPSAAE